VNSGPAREASYGKPPTEYYANEIGLLHTGASAAVLSKRLVEGVQKTVSRLGLPRDGQTNWVTAANTAHGTGTVWFASDRESACGCFQLVYGGAQLGPRQLFRLQLRLEQHRYTDLASHRPKIRSVYTSSVSPSIYYTARAAEGWLMFLHFLIFLRLLSANYLSIYETDLYQICTVGIWTVYGCMAVYERTEVSFSIRQGARGIAERAIQTGCPLHLVK